ncbi:MAG: 16S rRNA (guanine(527)-N(7))-methyltransferase RsmG [Alphaproteobacteria bacterium]|nr:16S rRNA (guanine(527)-N(7))-methyltransferase RsmG [Alphaproteobacteria bacterium]
MVENSVSRETLERLKAYEVSLHEWQKKFNLVSNASLEDAWNRHFLDSMQLFNFIPKTARTLCDFGSGAGFPGMVLAIMAKEKTPYLKVSLIESIRKKTLYLNEVNKITEANAVIINDRIENIPPQSFDVITSRAMASLKDLLNYTKKFFGKNTVCIFPKGKSYAEEIAEAEKFWKFDCKIVPSEMSREGVILIITNLSAIKGVK